VPGLEEDDKTSSTLQPKRETAAPPAEGTRKGGNGRGAVINNSRKSLHGCVFTQCGYKPEEGNSRQVPLRLRRKLSKIRRRIYVDELPRLVYEFNLRRGGPSSGTLKEVSKRNKEEKKTKRRGLPLSSASEKARSANDVRLPQAEQAKREAKKV